LLEMNWLQSISDMNSMSLGKVKLNTDRQSTLLSFSSGVLPVWANTAGVDARRQDVSAMLNVY
jgi:hypothetical protein